ncbi:MAG: hypothetical protein ACR2OD_10045 [Gaiellaceae bacterium]
MRLGPKKPEPTEQELEAQAAKRRQAGMAYQRLTATLGIVAIGTAIGAILGALDVAHWVTGLVVALACVVLAAVLWTVKL